MNKYVLGLLLAIPLPARALTFNVTYDPSVASAPAGFTSAFSDALQAFTNAYSDPIQINLSVGWGEVAGSSLAPGNLGQSFASERGFTYTPVRTALINDATSANDAIAVAGLGASDPTNGALFVMSNAEAKALGLLAANRPSSDGAVGFSSSVGWTFDPNNRAVAGKYDFIGIAEHEISEVMGRFGMLQNGFPGTAFSPIDLFRYTAPGVPDFTPVNGSYFSIDGGTTNVNTFNGTGGGDLSDWAGLTVDAFNAFSNPGHLEPLSSGDLTLMDVIGYNLIPVPEPSTSLLLGGGVAGLVIFARAKRG